MKRILQSLFFALILFCLSATAQEKKKQEIKIRAEVIDTKCYISGSMGDATGEEHKECAIMCAKAGVPLALLEEKTKTVYYAARLKGIAGANEILLPFVGDVVVITGRLVERGGAKMIMIDTIEKAN